MNKHIKISIFLFISLISCETVKDPNLLENKEINYCINFIQDKPDSILLSDSDLNIAKSLFDLNKLDYRNLQFYRLQIEELGYHVRCNQYANNLKIFTDEVFFHFNKDKTYKTLSGGGLIIKIDLNTEASMNQNDVIELYLKELNMDNNYNGNKDDIIQGCYDIEFGYYDLNAGISYSASNFTKAWIIKPKDQEYPFAFINDMTSTTIYYDDGIRY